MQKNIDYFLSHFKDVYLNVPSSKGVMKVQVSLYPEGIATFHFQGMFYAIEAKTGCVIYDMSSMYNLMNTIRHEENREAVLNAVKHYRENYPILNEIEVEGESNEAN